MLEQIVQKFRGAVLFLIVFSLCAVFVLQFGGPQAQGCSEEQAANTAARVYGRTITRSELGSALALAGADNYPEEMAKQYKLHDMVLYGLIERDLLAMEAEKLGYDVTEDEVLSRVAEEGVIHKSMSIDAGPYLPPSGPQRFSFEDKDGAFDKDNLTKFINYRLHRSVLEFARSQIDETLAQRMRELVASSVSVSPGEVWDAYVREKENVTLKYVRFSSTYYGQQLAPTEADIRAFMTEKAKDIDAEYEKQKPRYTGLEKQVRARHILIKVQSGADEATKQAARAKIDGLLARARAGEDFAQLAKDNSEDEGSGKKGGDLGFNPKGRMVKPFDEAQFALKPGEISDVVESTFGFHVIKAEAIREGDVPLDEAKREIAEKMYREQKAGELAKQAAGELLAKVKAGATLDDATAALSGAPATPTAEGEHPAPSDPLAPSVRDTRPFGRTDTPIAGPFDSSPLVKAAYALTEQAPLGNEPMQLGDDWFVYKLESRTIADQAGFTAEEQQRLTEAIRRRRQQDTVEAYVRGLRDKAVAAGEVFIEASLLPTDAEPAKPQDNG